MARLDDRLRRDLERAARPADPAGVYEELIRRRERRRIVRRIEATALAVAVVAGTLAGTYGLSRVFLADTTTAGEGGSPSVSMRAHVPESLIAGDLRHRPGVPRVQRDVGPRAVR